MNAPRFASYTADTSPVDSGKLIILSLFIDIILSWNAKSGYDPVVCIRFIRLFVFTTLFISICAMRLYYS